MGIGEVSNLSMTSLIMAAAGDVGSLAGGLYLCMASVTSARRSHMRMGGSLCSISAGSDTASVDSGLHSCVIGSGSCGVSLPKRSAQRLWITAILSDGASWTPFMASVRRRVVSNMQSVAIMAGTGIA